MACNEQVGFQPWLADKVLGARKESNQNARMECPTSTASARGNSPRLIIQAWVVSFKCLYYSSTKRSIILSAAKDCSKFAWTSWRAPWQHETAATCTGSTHHPFFS